METIIMAGGEGKRLRPLTCDTPKPLLPLLGKPIIEYILDLLICHGLDSATVTTGYLSGQIKEHFKNGYYKSVKLVFSEEDMPLGTAGSVKNASKGAEDELLVISGDALCDMDISAALEFHRKKRAMVTIIGKKVDDPREYGLIESDSDGRITGFIEKPDYSKVSGDIANTGIYILSRDIIDLIEENKSVDFGKDIFPMLLKAEMPMFVYEDEGYWCDIGSVKTYISCQHDILKGKVRCYAAKEADGEGNIINSTVPEGTVIIPPVYIGKDVNLGKMVVIEKGSVISSGAKLCSGAKVKGGIIGECASVGERASVCGAAVGRGARIKRAASVYEEAVIGSHSIIGENAVILPFIKVWPYKEVLSMTVLKENIQFEMNKRELFDDDGIEGETGIAITPEFLAGVGRSVGSIKNVFNVLVGYDLTKSSQASAMALSSGVIFSGKNVIMSKAMPFSQFLFVTKKERPDIAVYISASSRCVVRFLGADSLPVSHETERTIEEAFFRSEYPTPDFSSFGKICESKVSDEAYINEIMGLAPSGLKGQQVSVKTPCLKIKEIMSEVLLGLQVSESDELTFYIGSGGTTVTAYSKDDGFICFEKLLAIEALGFLCDGKDIALPEWAPRAIDEMAEFYERRVLRYSECSVGGRDADARRVAGSCSEFRDGLKLIVSVLSFFKRSGLNMKGALKLIPPFEVSQRTVKIDGNVGNTIAPFKDSKVRKTAEGICFEDEKGIVFMKPLKKGRAIKIYSESSSAEFAEEITQRIENILSGKTVLDIEEEKE